MSMLSNIVLWIAPFIQFFQRPDADLNPCGRCANSPTTATDCPIDFGRSSPRMAETDRERWNASDPVCGVRESERHGRLTIRRPRVRRNSLGSKSDNGACWYRLIRDSIGSTAPHPISSHPFCTLYLSNGIDGLNKYHPSLRHRDALVGCTWRRS